MNDRLTQDDLLAAALADLPPDSNPLPASTFGTAKPTTQFTLASLPFLTIYLQGAATYPEALQSFPNDQLTAWTAAASATGLLRYRRISYRPLSPDITKATIDHLGDIISKHGLLSIEYRQWLSKLVQDHPIIWESIGGSNGLLSKAASPERAFDAITSWQCYAKTLPIATATPTQQAPTVEAIETVNLAALLGLD